MLLTYLELWTELHLSFFQVIMKEQRKSKNKVRNDNFSTWFFVSRSPNLSYILATKTNIQLRD